MTPLARAEVRLRVAEQKLWFARWQARAWSAVACGLLLHTLSRGLFH